MNIKAMVTKYLSIFRNLSRKKYIKKRSKVQIIIGSPNMLSCQIEAGGSTPNISTSLLSWVISGWLKIKIKECANKNFFGIKIAEKINTKRQKIPNWYAIPKPVFKLNIFFKKKKIKK